MGAVSSLMLRAANWAGYWNLSVEQYRGACLPLQTAPPLHASPAAHSAALTVASRRAIAIASSDETCRDKEQAIGACRCYRRHASAQAALLHDGQGS